MIALYAQNLHFLGDDEMERSHDLCVHGSVFFDVNGRVLHAGDEEWCVSASALRFLRSLVRDHQSGREEHLIPCCGHFMVPSDDGASVTIVGCKSGADFGVTHGGGKVILTAESGEQMIVSDAEYRTAVIAFAESVLAFYRESPPRVPCDDFDRDGFSAFFRELSTLLDAVRREQIR